MLKSKEKHYLSVFGKAYGLPDETILRIMRENEANFDPENFDFDYWENLCREELKKEASAIMKDVVDDVISKIKSGNYV